MCNQTKHLQDSLAECGWEGAAQIRQQDASEAFTFITGALELPLLTLKMDIYHTGREDKEDDHKFVNERLLEVAIPEQQDNHVITLEDCLETYFNNRIEVKRYLQRHNTLTSVKSQEGEVVDRDPEKSETLHIETLELSGADSPIVSTPTSLGPSTPLTPIRPLDGRRRADSIFSQRYTRKSSEVGKFDEKKHLEDMLDSSSGGRPRSASLLRKEILMPAWQFFSLIRKYISSGSLSSNVSVAWYTDNAPKTDAQVAAHFSVKRPILGICLKRYTMLPNGERKRLDTYIDIPLDIGLPHFISDDRMKEEGPLFGNFKLVLQSVVCHRGVSVDSGHYIALVRDNTNEQPRTSDSDDGVQSGWLRFDDLSSQRVTQVDIKKALREESPYLLFYQVQPINEELASRGDPPPYAEPKSEFPSTDPSRETLSSLPSTTTTDTETIGDWDKLASLDIHQDSSHSADQLGRSSMSSNRRSSVAFEDIDGSMLSVSRGRTQPPTPDEQKSGFLSASRRGSRTWLSGNNKSRPSSQSGEGRLSLTLSRLTGRSSKDKLQITEGVASDDPMIVINKVHSAEDIPHARSPVKEKKEGVLGRSKSKREKKDRLRSKSRDPGEKSRPDRECIVM